jgi:hypothetical protein
MADAAGTGTTTRLAGECAKCVSEFSTQSDTAQRGRESPDNICVRRTIPIHEYDQRRLTSFAEADCGAEDIRHLHQFRRHGRLERHDGFDAGVGLFQKLRGRPAPGSSGHCRDKSYSDGCEAMANQTE